LTRRKRAGTQWASSAIKAAAAVGVNQRTLYEWFAHGCPERTPRGYDVEAIRAWQSANKGNGNGNRNGASADAQTDHARLKKAQADKEEARAALTMLELRIERGEYLPLAEVKERDLARIAVVKRGLLSLSDGLAGRLVGLQQKEIKVAIRTAVRGLLEKFARM
jgi:hypothetical protein